MRDVVSLTWPAVLQGMVATAVFSTDRLIIGRYASEALSSMAIASPIAWSVTSIFGAYMAGVVAVTGRAVGALDSRRAAAALRSSLVFAVFIGVIVAAAAWIGREPLIALLTSEEATSEAVRSGAADYLAIVLCAAPLFFVAATAMASLQAAGDTRTPLIIAAMAGVANLALSWVLVFGHLGAPELGLRGAAIGTVLAFALQAAGALFALHRSRGPLRLSATSDSDERRRALGSILRISRSALGERLLYHTAYVASIALVGHLGDVSLAAHESLLGIEAIGFTAAGGFAIAAATLVAQGMGRKSAEEAYRSGQTAAAIGLAVGLALGAIFLIFPRQLIGLFTTDEAVIETGAQCLRIAAIAQPAMILADTWSGALRGAGDTFTPLVSAILGPVFMRLGACWFFAWYLDMGLVGFWIGTTLDWYVRATWTGIAFRRRRWAERYREI
ncbi:MAG: MATE family efflux transporter [Bradymonadaceae bacterium]